MLDRSTKEPVSTPSEPTVTVHPAAGSARRPVRSEFARLGPTFAAKRVVSVAIALVVLGGALYVTLGLGGHGTSQEVPVIKSEGDYKEKPEEPGGIDIPHQDVQVYQKLDQQGGGDAQQAEHLLPQAETPQAQLMPSGTTSFSDNATIEAAHLPPASENGSSSVQASSGEQPSAEAPPPSASVSSPVPAVPASPETTAAVVSSSGNGSSSAVAAVPSLSVPVATTSSPVASSSVPASVAHGTGGIASPVSVAPAPVPAVVPPVPSHVAQPSSSQAAASVSAKVPDTSVAASKKVEATVAAINQSLSASTPVSKVKPQEAKVQAPATAVSPSSSSSSGRGGAVQLASFPDRAVAEQTVDKMQAKYGAHLGGAKLRVVQADLGAKGIYYRIQSQQLPEAKAKEICAELKSLKAGCLVVHP